MMKDNVMCSDNLKQAEANVEQDLWDAILHADGVTYSPWQPEQPLTEDLVSVEENPHAHVAYPWNPSMPEAEEFFAQTEKESIFDGWKPEDVSVRSGTFFAQLDQLWSATSLQEALVQKFAVRMPHVLMAAIAQRAQQVVSTSLTLADQLVQCVQEALPNLAELAPEDLYVLARPLAYEMRDADSQAIESTLATVRPIDWQALSEVEQTRLSLAVARYAIAELKKA
jgi:hypothetical protein